MHPMSLDRRRVLSHTTAPLGASALSACGVNPAASSAQRSAQWTAKQFHNQPVQSHQHSFLVDLWSQVAKETDGRLMVTVFAQNNQIPGSDPAALDMLQQGELEFFTLMGGILGRVVPVAEIQGLPFAFANHGQVHQVNDGALGEYLGKECAAKSSTPLIPRAFARNWATVFTAAGKSNWGPRAGKSLSSRLASSAKC